MRTALVIVLAGADPYDFRIARRDRNVADGYGFLVVENRSPSGARVDALPEPTAGGSNVNGVWLFGMSFDIDNAPAGDRRAD